MPINIAYRQRLAGCPERLQFSWILAVEPISPWDPPLVMPPGGATGRGLLQHALLHRKARLAVVASAFSDVTHLQCWEPRGVGARHVGLGPGVASYQLGELK